MTTATDRPKPAGVRGALVRSVALPSEHGGWSFLLEPVLLGLLVAFSWPGVLLAVAALGAFLAHQPLKTAIKDVRAGRNAPRTVLAKRFAAGYSLVAVAALAGVLVLAGPQFLLAL